MKQFTAASVKEYSVCLLHLLCSFDSSFWRQLRHLRRNREFPITNKHHYTEYKNRLRLHLHKTLQPALQRGHTAFDSGEI